MIYFGPPSVIRGWKPQPKTKSGKFWVSEPENSGGEIRPELEPAGPKIHRAKTRNCPTAIPTVSK
jgi:hypothetical protein